MKLPFSSCIIFYLIFQAIFQSAYAQKDEVLESLRARDSISSLRGNNIFQKTAVSREVHNLFFRNIYTSGNYNEENEFNLEINRLKAYDNKIIDTIHFIQVNALGENVFDSTIKSNRFELFLSKKLHRNTSLKIIENRFMLIRKGDVFSPYRAYENARLIRNSNIFHDVRISGTILPNDSNHIVLYVILQDEFPYGFSYSPRSITNFEFGIENQNIAGSTHNLSSRFRINSDDNNQPFGYRFQYSVPNIFHRSFINAYAFYQNFSRDKYYQIGATREFVNPEIRWAGGVVAGYRDIMLNNISGASILNRVFRSETWLSHAFPLKSYNTTVNAFIAGLGHTWSNNTGRPPVSSNSNFNFWNSNFFLASLGYSRIRYTQDRIVNGFGRTEDIPLGISVRALFGIDMTEFGVRNYYGGQILSQYYLKSGSYVNFGIKTGFFSKDLVQSQGVLDIHFQKASRTFKLGKFRLRNHIYLRGTVGIHHDSTSFITLNDYNGIRGLENWQFRGNNRYTFGFQPNLLLPFSFSGFRFSIFGLVELAKIDYKTVDVLNSPLRAGATFGIAFKNENLVFDVLQFQYGFYPSSSDLNGRGFSITSILPFPFQNLDISKPSIVLYE